MAFVSKSTWNPPSFVFVEFDPFDIMARLMGIRVRIKI